MSSNKFIFFISAISFIGIGYTILKNIKKTDELKDYQPYNYENIITLQKQKSLMHNKSINLNKENYYKQNENEQIELDGINIKENDNANNLNLNNHPTYAKFY